MKLLKHHLTYQRYTKITISPIVGTTTNNNGAKLVVVIDQRIQLNLPKQILLLKQPQMQFLLICFHRPHSKVQTLMQMQVLYCYNNIGENTSIPSAIIVAIAVSPIEDNTVASK